MGKNQRIHHVVPVPVSVCKKATGLPIFFFLLGKEEEE
jgi:hypothetical protein